ncbi:hypothetical protein FB639_001256, partial [Coemansia asiatica]
MLLLRNKGCCCCCVTSLTRHAYAFASPNTPKELSKCSSRLYSSKTSPKDKTKDTSGSGSCNNSSSCCATIIQCAHTPKPSPLPSDVSAETSHNATVCFYGAQTKTESAKYCETAIRRDFGYPIEYHAGSFPWLLSAERQRTPIDDLSIPVVSSSSGILNSAAQWLPLSARR